MDRRNILKLSNKNKGTAGCILLAAGFVLMLVSRNSLIFARWYSTHIYSIWVNITGRIMGTFPVSVSEVLLYVALFAAALSCFRLLVRCVKKCAGKSEIITWILDIYLLAGILFFLYVINCGINYQRESFAESAGIQLKEYSTEELKTVCLWLTEEVNSRSSEVRRDKEGMMLFAFYSRSQL